MSADELDDYEHTLTRGQVSRARLFEGMPQFLNREVFEAAMVARRGSVEHDFGLRWRSANGRTSWRISWIRWTCEVYAEELFPGRQIVVLGIFNDGVDVARTLGDWAPICGNAGSLEWAVAQIRGASCRVG